MSDTLPEGFDPTRDLLLERVVDVPRERVWRAWTRPEELKQWFAPKPWTTPESQLDLRPGGICRTVMRSPEGVDYPYVGCYLEVIPNERLTFTDALGPELRPVENPFFTASIILDDAPGGTRYRAWVRHRDSAGRQRHEEMGFHQGWGTCLTQLVAMIKAG